MTETKVTGIALCETLCRGHNGIRSINKTFGGKSEVWKLKIGIGRPLARDPETVAKYVMDSFSEGEIPDILESYTELYMNLISGLIKI